jgi:hypothetical protein
MAMETLTHAQCLDNEKRLHLVAGNSVILYAGMQECFK